MTFAVPLALSQKVEIDGKHFFVFLRINPCSAILIDCKGRYWQYIAPLTKPVTGKNNFGAFPCQKVCKKNIRRPHLFCVGCIYRRVWTGKMPNLFRVKPPYVLFTRYGRKQERIKNMVSKKLQSIVEFLSYL